LATIVELEKAPDGRRALEVLFRYISTVSEISREELAEALAKAAPEAKEIIMTLAEQLRQEGLNDGIQKGRLEGAAGVLRRQLELKFGALSEDVSARLETATYEQVSVWTDRILVADSLAAVFADAD
jgi:flagellar biosynthesis/type III secretory pathway protein FliH